MYQFCIIHELHRWTGSFPSYPSLTPLSSHVSHTQAQTDERSSRSDQRNPNVLISGDKQRQGKHWAALTHTHRLPSPICELIKELLRPHLGPLNHPSSFYTSSGGNPHHSWGKTKHFQKFLRIHISIFLVTIPTLIVSKWIKCAWSCFDNPLV